MAPYRVVEHQIPAAHIREYPHATAHSDQDELFLAVKQYIPLDNPNPRPGDVTIIAGHANAFNKELYEPLWEDLINRVKAQGWNIRSIWVADVVWQGQSGIINEQVLGNDPCWHDHARDLMHMINLKRRDMPRPIMGVGHSMGACQLVKLAIDHPSLFTTLILIDPIIQMNGVDMVLSDDDQQPPGMARMSTFRRPIWPSRAQAKLTFAKSPLYRSWDPRCLDKWVQFGLRDCPNHQFPEAQAPQVSLTTPVSQEVWTFVRTNYEGYGLNGNAINKVTHPDIDVDSAGTPFYRSEPQMMFKKLPEVRPSCLYIFGEASPTSTPEANDRKVSMTGIGVGGSGGVPEGRVKGVSLKGVGHLVAMEAPQRTADEIVSWMTRELDIFHTNQDMLNKNWESKSLKQKQEVDARWEEAMGGRPIRKGKL